ncbi:MAG: hypothetical protein WBM08_00690 [Prochlorococcaceae cyanobacterium]
MERTIGELTSLLVSRGGKRVDVAADEGRGFGRGCWTIFEAEDDPTSVLIIGREKGSMSVNFDRDSGLLQTLELDDDEGGTVMALAWWPGLEKAEELTDLSVALWGERSKQIARWLTSGEPDSSFWGGTPREA